MIKLSHIGKATLILCILFIGAFAEYRYQALARYQGAGSEFLLGKSVSQVSRLEDQEKPQSIGAVDFSIFWEVWSLLERDYVDPNKLDAVTMVDGATAGLAASLGDPYTVYLPKDDNERSAQDLAGAFYGVGIELGYIDGVLAAIAPLPGTPSDIAGIQAGDLIIRVADPLKGIDEDTRGWTLEKAVDVIRGPRGTAVTLTIVREGLSEPKEISITRDEIVIKSATVEFVEHAGKRVAHIKLSRFGEKTEGEWNTIVSQILAEKGSITGIVLDMRNNPGGFFDGAIMVASDFIADGVVVAQKDRLTTTEYTVLKGKNRLAGIPVEVLVNKGSASASEIVAGALRDRVGAKLVGQKTFGKGTVQDRRELSNGAGIHITIASWLLPSGDSINHEGIPVDVEVEFNPDTEEDDQLLKAIEEL